MKDNHLYYIVGKDEKINYAPGENGMLLLVGPPGCGKTYSVITPNIVCNNGCSMFIDDKKGNLYRKCSKKLVEQGYKVYNMNLIDFSGNLHVNIFEYAKNRRDIVKLVHFLIPENPNEKDTFWTDTSRMLAIALIEIGKKEYKQFTLKHLIYLAEHLPTKEDDFSLVDEIVDKQSIRFGELPAHSLYRSVRNCAEGTWLSIRISLNSALSYLNEESLFSITDTTNIDFKTLGDEKVAIFITSSDTDSSLDAFVKLIYRQVCNTLIEYADASEYSALNNHVRFILDDMASGATIPDFDCILANCRSRNISFIIGIQSLNQLKGLYGKKADAILDCINVRLYFSSANLSSMQYLSEIMNEPLCNIQMMREDEICLERRNSLPKIIKRYEKTKELIR